jgi:hypothetical protein
MAAIFDGAYGVQRIASHLMLNAGDVSTLPLSRSFGVFGQRYTVDAHVFSQVTYDRIPERLMPDPLDVAFATFGNDSALPLLGDRLLSPPEYAGALDGARLLVDAHGAEYWDTGLYTLWLGALRSLSPAADLRDPSASGMPELTGTELWGRRLLNAQLGSWAQLRHDTLLYAKQSYTGIPACDYPDAYVDPYPEFFEALARFAERGVQLAATLAVEQADMAADFAAYFQTLRDTMTTLAELARNEMDGAPLSAEQLDFVKQMVRIESKRAGSGSAIYADGWFADLYFTPESAIEFDPSIADVHTQPADWSGNPVGNVLHVGTAFPRMMVVSVDGCSGPRAYVGAAFAYHEQVTGGFTRLTDSIWSDALLQGGIAADAPWLEPVLGP